jgi:hypothetical protein
MLYLLHVPKPKCFIPEHSQMLRWIGNKERVITLNIITYLSRLSLQKINAVNHHSSLPFLFSKHEPRITIYDKHNERTKSRTLAFNPLVVVNFG